MIPLGRHPAQSDHASTDTELPLDCGDRERQQCDCPSTLDRRRQLALMTRAITGNATRDDFAAFAQKVRQGSRVLVVDPRVLLCAKTTYLAAPCRSPTKPAAVV